MWLATFISFLFTSFGCQAAFWSGHAPDGALFEFNLDPINPAPHPTYAEHVYGSTETPLTLPNHSCFRTGYLTFPDEPNRTGSASAQICDRRDQPLFRAYIHDSTGLWYHVDTNGRRLSDVNDTTSQVVNATNKCDALPNPDNTWLGDLTAYVPTAQVVVAADPGVMPERRFLELELVHDAARISALGLDGAADDALALVSATALFFGQAGADSGMTYDLTLVLKAQHFMADENFWDGTGRVAVNANGHLDSEDLIADLAGWISGTQPASYNFPYEQNGSAYETPVGPIVYLLSHENFQGAAIGLAYVGTACHPRNRVGLLETRQDNFDRNAIVLAHELGHTLDMDHDGDGNACEDNEFLMASSAGSNLDITWSSCSVATFNSYAADGGIACFPTELDGVSDGWCGDGLVTGLESCDTYGQLTSCCNGTTCQLLGDAQCEPTNHDCCQQDGSCQPITFDPLSGANVVCRDQANDCDVPEYCHGGPTCPDDVHLPMGHSCTSAIWKTAGRCYDGRCVNGDDECYLAAKRYGLGLYLDDGCARQDCGVMTCASYYSWIGCFLVSSDQLETNGMSCDDGAGMCVDGSCTVPNVTVPVCGDGVVTAPETCDCGSGSCFDTADPTCDPRTCQALTNSSSTSDAPIVPTSPALLYALDGRMTGWARDEEASVEYVSWAESWRLRQTRAQTPASTYMNVTLESGFAQYRLNATLRYSNFLTAADQCQLLVDGVELWSLTSLYTTNTFHAASFQISALESVVLRIDSYSSWGACFLQNLTIEGVIDHEPNPISELAATLDLETLSWYVFGDVGDVVVSDAGLELYADVEGGHVELVVFLPTVDITQINVTVTGRSWEHGDACWLSISEDYGLAATLVGSVVADNSTVFTYTTSLGSPPYLGSDSYALPFDVSLVLEADFSGYYDACVIERIDVEYPM